MNFKALHSLKAMICASLMLMLPAWRTSVLAQSKTDRTIQGVIITSKRESVEGATITARYSSGEQKTRSDQEGRFTLSIPREQVTLKIADTNGHCGGLRENGRYEQRERYKPPRRRDAEPTQRRIFLYANSASICGVEAPCPKPEEPLAKNL